MTSTVTSTRIWHEISHEVALPTDRGVAVLIGDVPVAVFRLAVEPGESPEIYAVGHIDPITRAPVIARGLVGSVAGTPYVASPIYKERYELATGKCLDDPGQRLEVFAVRVVDGIVAIQENLPDIVSKRS